MKRAIDERSRCRNRRSRCLESVFTFPGIRVHDALEWMFTFGWNLRSRCPGIRTSPSSSPRRASITPLVRVGVRSRRTSRNRNNNRLFIVHCRPNQSPNPADRRPTGKQVQLHILIDSSGLAAHAGQLRRAPNSRGLSQAPSVCRRADWRSRCRRADEQKSPRFIAGGTCQQL